MKRKSLLFLLLMALVAPWAAQAQVTIGDLENAGNNSYLPMNSLYDYSYTQQIYTADEIGMAGTINAITVWMYGNANLYEMPFDIYMVETDKENFASNTDWETVTSSDIVYSGSVTVHNTDAEAYTFELDAPFAYSGTGNLLIAFDNNTGNWKSGLNGKVFTAVDGVIRAIYARRDGSDYDPTNMSGVSATGTLAARNVIEIAISGGGGPTCTKPSTLDVTDITGYTATCTWENTGAASYTFEWKKASDSDYTVVSGLTANTYALSSLEPMTAYTVRVKAVCGTDLESGYKSASFTTLDVCPDGKVCIGQGTATNSYLPTYNYYNYSLTQQIYSADEIGEAALIESVDIYSVGSVTRNLEIYMVSTEKTTFESATDWIPATESDLVFSGQVAFAANSWNTMEFSTPFIYYGRTNVALIVRDVTGSYVSSINFFVFDAEGNQAIYAYRDTPGAYDIAAPGVNGTLLAKKNRVRFGVSELPSCFQPSGLVVSEVEARQAVLSWTENGEATAWEIEVTGDYTTTWNANAIPFTLVGLEPDTEYSVRVRANCGDGDYSEWSAAVTFTTDVTCHAPTALTVSDIEAFTANVSWTGTETTHQLRYVDNPNYFFQGFVTDRGAMADGSDASWLKEGESTFGPGVQQTSSNWLADDFVVNTATALTEIEVYSYQTGSTTESTYTGLYAVIYDGNPADSTTNIVWGDMETNIMTSTAFTNCYRGNNNDPTGMTRPIMAITASNLNIRLEPGTYWLVYTLTGTLSSGPWGAPYCEPIIGMTGNGMQYLGSSNTWQALENNGKTFGPAMRLMFGDMETFDWTYVNNIDANTYAMTNLEPETPYLVQVRATCGGNDGNSEWASATFTTLPTCMTPTALTVSDIEARQVVLSWTENGDATAWDVEVTGEYTTTWNATTNPYTLVGLEPSTLYTVKVRAKCSDTDFSEWSQEVSFTTDLSCYPPTNLTVSDITATAATLGWTSTNDNFDVWYRPLGAGATLEYNFEEGMSGWTTIDADNDGYDWVLGSQCGGVYLVEGGSLAGNGHNGSEDMMCSGSYSNYTSAALTPDNYLVSPQVTLGGSITFWAQAQDASYAAEHFGVAVSTTGNTNASDFTTIAEWTMTARGYSNTTNVTVAERANENHMRGGNRDTGAWFEFTVDLSNYSGMGYVAIRHFDCTDLFILNVDDIAITLPGDVTYEWVEVSNATNPYTITGLTPETTYEAQVRSNCGDYDGVSTWVHTTFTTLDVCNTPENLTAIDSLMTAYTATLNWNGIQNSYNLRYGVEGEPAVFFREDFENQVMPEGFVNGETGWEIWNDTVAGTYCIASSNYNVSSTTATISMTATFDAPGTIEFSSRVSSEGGSWDYGYFSIDGTQQYSEGGTTPNTWTQRTFEVGAGTHTFTWNYRKDSSVNGGEDRYYIDNIVLSVSNINWIETIEGITEAPYTLTGLERTTEYFAQVQGVCPSGLTEWSNLASFTTTVSCWQPTELVATDVMADYAILDWTANGEETAWEIEVSDDQEPPVVTYWNATEKPFTLVGLFPETTYSVRVRANCGEFDGYSEWSDAVSFTTLGYCDIPEDLEVGNITFYNATASWTGIQNSYNLKYWKYEIDAIVSENFNSAIPADWTNDTIYPWTVTDGYIQSGNAGMSSSTSAISVTVTYEQDGVIEFDAECRGEGTSTYYDHCDFAIDGNRVFYHGADLTNEGWLHYSFEVEAGVHTFTWSYSKDSSVNPTGDYFAIDNVAIGYAVTTEYPIVENIQDNSYLFTDLDYDATYFVQVQGMDENCTAGTEWTDAVSFFFPMPSQTIALEAGANWCSFNVEITLNDLKAALVAAAAGSDINVITIKSQTQVAQYNPNNGRWTGRLTSLDLSKMYKITIGPSGTACEITLQGYPVNPADYPVTISQGVNWIAFPLNTEMTVSTAFAGFPVNGDMVKSQQQNASYNRGRWMGQLSTLQPGKGYVYKSAATSTKTFTFPIPTNK